MTKKKSRGPPKLPSKQLAILGKSGFVYFESSVMLDLFQVPSLSIPAELWGSNNMVGIRL